jgi:hypothetical protein
MFPRILNETHASDRGGSLHVLHLKDIPFIARRLYWINGISPDSPRGFHAHKKLNQVIIVIEGNVHLKLFRGREEISVRMKGNDPHIFVPFGTWREIYAESNFATVLVVADSEYAEEDYLRDWKEYLQWFSRNLNGS